MMRRLSASIVILLLVTLPCAAEQPPPSPLAAFDEATLRHAGIDTEAAGLLKHLRFYLRNDGDPITIKTLIEQLADPRFEKRDEAARELLAVGRPALDALRQARKTHEDPEARNRASHCVAVLESRLDANVMMAAVRRLITLRADGAAECFLELLPVVDWEIQDEIVHGLPRVARRDGKLDPVLLAALADKLPQRRAAAALAVALNGDENERVAVGKRLNDEDAEVRLRAAQGLLAVHDAASLPALIALLHEPTVEISWSAEELLHWVAGDTAPAAKVGAASADERTKAVDAWTAWHKSHADKIDWDQLEQAPRRPGLYLACDRDTVWLGGCVGGRRWTLKQPAHDAVLLPDNRLLVVPCNGSCEVLSCDLTGKVLWQRRQHNGRDYVMCQRLPNGRFLLASCQNTVEMTATGEEVSSAAFDEEMALADAWQPRGGLLLGRTQHGVAAIDRATGRVLDSGEVNPGRFEGLHKFAVLPDGRCVLADGHGDRLIETNAHGETLRVLPVWNPYSVEPLRNGNYLVLTSRAAERRILEMDAAGRTLWEVYTPDPVHRVRTVLDKVRIGFDKPRPLTPTPLPTVGERGRGEGDFNLDAVEARVRGLRDADPQVRLRSAHYLWYLRPTDANAIDALTAALDDKSPIVREHASDALGAIGQPAVPALVHTLKKGTFVSRGGAMSALCNIGSGAADAVPDLIGLVKDSQMPIDLRHTAVVTLGAIGPPAKAAIPALLDALKGENDHLRYVAAATAVSVAANDPVVIQGLIGALRDTKYPEGQEAAALGLQRLGPKAKAALPVLIETLQSSTAPVLLRRRAAVTLGLMEREARPAVPVLLTLLKDVQQPMELRATIARSLGNLGATAKPAIPVFRDLLHDPKLSGELANELLEGLGDIGADAVPALVGVVKEGSMSVSWRGEAIRQLGKLGSAAVPALPALENAIKDSDERISGLAAWAVSRIKDHSRDQATPLN